MARADRSGQARHYQLGFAAPRGLGGQRLHRLRSSSIVEHTILVRRRPGHATKYWGYSGLGTDRRRRGRYEGDRFVKSAEAGKLLFLRSLTDIQVRTLDERLKRFGANILIASLVNTRPQR